MKSLGYDLINSNVSDSDIQSFLTLQKQHSKKTEIEVFRGILESIVKSFQDNNSEELLKNELDKLGKIVSLFSNEGFQYAVEHKKNYLAQELPSLSHQKREQEDFNKFDRDLIPVFRQNIATSFIKYNSSRKDSLIGIITDFYKLSDAKIYVDILNNVKDFYHHNDLTLNTSAKPKI